MNSIIKKLAAGSAAAFLVLASTGMAYADKGHSGGGSRGGSSGGSMSSAKMGSAQSSGGMKVNQGSNQTLSKQMQTGQHTAGSQVNKGNLAQTNKQVTNKTNLNTNNMAGKSGFAKGEPNPSAPGGIKLPSQQSNYKSNNYKSNYFCSTPWSKGGCFPSNYYCGWNYGGFGFGYGWNSCWNFPWYRNYCYTPCYNYCTYPIYDYCCTTPVCYTYQQPVSVTKVIEVIQQPAPVVETVTTQTTTNATATVVKPPSHDVSFLTNSVVGR